jgi:hypothetical protein
MAASIFEKKKREGKMSFPAGISASPRLGRESAVTQIDAPVQEKKRGKQKNSLTL